MQARGLDSGAASGRIRGELFLVDLVHASEAVHAVQIHRRFNSPRQTSGRRAAGLIRVHTFMDQLLAKRQGRSTITGSLTDRVAS